MNTLPDLPITITDHAMDRFYERCPAGLTVLSRGDRASLIRRAVRCAPVIRETPNQLWLAGLGELRELVLAVKVEPTQIVVTTVLSADQVQTTLECMSGKRNYGWRKRRA